MIKLPYSVIVTAIHKHFQLKTIITIFIITSFFAQPICIVATLLLSLSEVIKSFETLMIGRFLLGIVGAIGTGITPMYISEISASHIRGIIGSLCSVSIVFGILIGNVLGLKQVDLFLLNYFF